MQAYLDSNPTKNARQKYLYQIALQELYCFLGMMLLFGVFRAHREKIANLYSDDPNLSPPILKASMPRDLFKIISRFLRFDDPSTRVERTLLDRLAPVRHVFDTINNSLIQSYHPGKWLTVDEHMARFRGKCFNKTVFARKA